MAIPVGTAVGYLDLDYSSFSKKLDTAVTEANGLSTKFADTLGSGLTTIGDKISSVGTKLTTSISIPLGIATASAIKFGAEFDKGMANVKAVSGATSEEFQEMRDAAIDWGEKTVYTATEASDALYYMGLAGWDANESVSALGPVLNLAAAGNLELGRTSDIVTDAMTAMKLEAGEYTDGIENTVHFTNALAAAMANSNTDVDQMGEAFKYVAPLAGAANMEIDDLSLALGLMANVGVKASQAGTGLRQALKSVISPTDKAAGYMEQYGVSLFDAEGNAKSMRQFMEELRGTFGDLAVDVYDANGELKTAEQIMEEYGHSLPVTQQEKLNAIVQIFGTRALPGVLGIIEQSDENFNQLADAIDNSDRAFVKYGDEVLTISEYNDRLSKNLIDTSESIEFLGAAEGMAQVQMDNLQGDWIKFTSALGTTKIEITDLVNGVLREFVQKLTEMVQWFNNLDDEQQKHILKIAAIIAATGPLLLVIGKTITGIGNLIKAFSTIGGAMTKLNVGFKMLGTHLSKNIIEGFKLARAGFSGLAAEASPLGAALGSITLPMVAIAGIVATLIGSFVHLMNTNEEFRNRIIGIWDGIKAKFDEAGQKITAAINAIGFNFESVTEAVKAAFDWFANVLAPFFTAFFETLSSAIGAILDIITGVFEIIGGLFAGFRDGDWSMFVQGLQDFFGGLFDLMATPFIFVFNTFTEILNSFGVTWTEIWTAIKDFFVGIWTGVKDFFVGIWNGVVEFFAGIWNGIMSIFTTLGTGIVETWTGIKEKVIEVITGIRDGAVELWNKIKDSVKTIVNNLKENVIAAWNTLKERVIGFVENLKERLTTLWNNIKTTVRNTVSSLKDNVVNLWNGLKTSVTNIVTNIKNSLISTFTSLKTSLVNKVTEIKDGIVNVFSNIYNTFLDIGSNIVNGIWDGISAGWEWLTDKVSELANGLFEAAKSALGIASPSKVFRDGVGYWIPLGAAEGVKKGMPKAVSEIQDSFDDGLSQITGNVDLETSLVSVIDVTKQAIEGVAFWFETTEERLRGLVDDMRQDLLDLVSTSDMLVTPDGIIIDAYKEKPSDNLETTKRNGRDSNDGNNVVNNFYYTFNSPEAIDEIEAARRFEETQRDLSEGF